VPAESRAKGRREGGAEKVAPTDPVGGRMRGEGGSEDNQRGVGEEQRDVKKEGNELE